MNMQESVLYIVLILLCIVIYLLITQRKGTNEDKREELGNLKDSLTSSINTMSTSFNALSKVSARVLPIADNLASSIRAFDTASRSPPKAPSNCRWRGKRLTEL